MHSRFQTALTTLAADLQAAIAPMLADRISGAARSRSGGDAAACDRSGRTRWLCATAACRCLRAPTFLILTSGAIARGVSNRWYFGGNMGFSATMQQTVHAEQSAISHAWLRGETSLRAITVNYAVRSLPSVYERTEQRAGAAHSSAGSRSMPGALSAGRLWPEDLEIKTLLMDEQDHGFPVRGDALTQAAIQASNRCRRPTTTRLPAWRWS